MEVVDKSFGFAGRLWKLTIAFDELLSTNTGLTPVARKLARQLAVAEPRLEDPSTECTYSFEGHNALIFVDTELGNDEIDVLTSAMTKPYAFDPKTDLLPKSIGHGVYILRAKTCFTRFDLRAIKASPPVINAAHYNYDQQLGHAIWVTLMVDANQTQLLREVEQIML